uniref:Uncharacterized protein n=1 Tax=Chelonoidis abingdonii TaxID=106734 RepID=A0A8C0GR69_CHEAB
SPCPGPSPPSGRGHRIGTASACVPLSNPLHTPPLIHPQTHPSLHPPTHSSIQLLLHPPPYTPLPPPIHPPTHTPIHPSIHPYTHPSIHPHTHPSLPHTSIHPPPIQSPPPGLTLSLLPRLGVPSDCAGIVSFLCSPNTSYITGETMVVGGGAPSRL